MNTSNDNIEQYKQLHENDSEYGSTSVKFLEEIELVVSFLKPATILDYGCGKGKLLIPLKERFPSIDITGYDPAIPEFQNKPQGTFDLVINTDVLEHIPEAELDAILKEIAKYSENVYFNLHHCKAHTILPNGENAHCTVKPPAWYKKKIGEYFNHITLLRGRTPYVNSVALTFSIPGEIRSEFLQILKTNDRSQPLSPFSKMKRMIRWALRDGLLYIRMNH